jgi:hypothetical protein
VSSSVRPGSLVRVRRHPGGAGRRRWLVSAAADGTGDIAILELDGQAPTRPAPMRGSAGVIALAIGPDNLLAIGDPQGCTIIEIS